MFLTHDLYSLVGLHFITPNFPDVNYAESSILFLRSQRHSSGPQVLYLALFIAYPDLANSFELLSDF